MKTHLALIIFLLSLFIWSCKKKLNDDAINSQVNAVDIYMAGYEFGSGLAIATYWKNGIATHLTDGTKWAEANSIIVSGNDVYVAGVENNNAVYWKNSALHILANSFHNFPSVANSIAISGNDVYVAGTEFGRYPGTNITQKLAKYWKNGSLSYLTAPYFGSEASSIAVSGNDVYIAGNAWESFSLDSIGVPCDRVRCQHYEEATYWKNSVPVYLTDGTTTQAHATGIAVSGSDVYVCGDIIYDATTSLGGLAAYWKNGSMINLAYSGTDAIWVSGIAVSGNDVYVSGTGYVNGGFSKALCWKNSVGTPLQGIGQQISGTAKAIGVNGNDIYIAGNLFYLPTSQSPPLPLVAVKCWKNNSMLSISIDSTKLPVVKSIYLVKK